jgi:uncharacterized repeat protein (TIGR03803 family)
MLQLGTEELSAQNVGNYAEITGKKMCRKRTLSSLILAGLTLFMFAAIAAAQEPSSTTFSTTVSFDGSDGFYPEYMSLAQGFDGNLYGTSVEGGTSTACGLYGCGTVFKVTTAGKLTTLHSFGSSNAYPYGSLVQDSNGKLYGTTYGSATSTKCTGSGGCGTVFKITTSGTLTTLHTFKGTDGYGPSGLIQATDGNFYGTTNYGGSYDGGTVFKITSGGTLTTLYNFCESGCEQSSYPLAGLVQGTDGDLYGTTGGVITKSCPLSCGTVFKITTSGTLTTLHTFDGTDGYIPRGLIQATDGDFYGLTTDGGSSNGCANGCGTAFKITSSGTLTKIYDFCSDKNCTDGSYPAAALVQGIDGNFYGTASFGGTYDKGTVFKLTSSGTLTTLHSFESGKVDGTWPGYYPGAGLFEDTDGVFYGTTIQGGLYGGGTIFSVANGLDPFLMTNPTSGKVKAAVTILGTDLTGATSVTFDGKSATFTVVSSTEITTTVPTGAKTGSVEVKTPSGTSTSNVVFTVTD